MTRISLVDQTQHLIAQYLKSGDIVIDATAGNGYDTAFLANTVGPHGHVYVFDLQKKALTTTKSHLATQGLNHIPVTYCLSDHQHLSQHIAKNHSLNIKAIMFNLGYLPGGEKTMTTQPESTLIAIQSAVNLLAIEGCLSIIAYPGHSAGVLEFTCISEWFTTLNPLSYALKRISIKNTLRPAPEVFFIRLRR
ncbi:MAG: class I SAM-dependent methyltransferase [Methylococcales bacterium]|jgi:hypothetical protein|nr:class I SAM-dependent methyltransferase [Methylococcales bacterium]